MKKIVIVAFLISILVLTAMLFSACALTEINLQVYSAKYYTEYIHKETRTFYSGNELKEYFADGEKYSLTADFDKTVDELTQNGFFEKSAVLCLTLSGIGSDTTVKAVKHKNQITFTINVGMCEDIGTKFFFFEIPKSEEISCRFE